MRGVLIAAMQAAFLFICWASVQSAPVVGERAPKHAVDDDDGHVRKLGKIYAAGSGQNMLSLPSTISEIVKLSGKKTPNVLYVGTATYDDPGPQKTQTQAFLDLGCTVDTLQVAVASPTVDEMNPTFEKADIVLVSGGNTLFARDRWLKLGIDGLMREVMANGTVLSGGSAGMIIWFDGGHSDSSMPLHKILCLSLLHHS